MIYYTHKFLYFLVQAEIPDEIVDITENETTSATFTCKAIGEPLPTVSWYFNDIKINVSISNKYYVSNSFNETIIISSLTIVNVLSSDVGIYTCHAKNIIGIAQQSGILTVNGMYISYYLLIIGTRTMLQMPLKFINHY